MKLLLVAMAAGAVAADKPNILVIWGDHIGWSNLSFYEGGLMGEQMAAHLKSVADYPPVQGGKSFDMSNVVEEFINTPRQ